MRGLSQVTLAGNLVADPTEKVFGETHICSLVVAINTTFIKDGQKREKVAYVECKAYKSGVEHPLCRFASKGDPILITGRLDQESWETKDGQKRSKLLVTINDFVLLKRKPEQDRVLSEEDIDLPI